MTDPDTGQSHDGRERERTDGGTTVDQRDEQPRPDERMVVDDDFEQRMDDSAGGTTAQDRQQSPPSQQSPPEQQPARQPPDASQDAMQPREAQPVKQDRQPPRTGQQRQREQANQPPQQSPQENVQLDPWEIHDNIVNSMNKSETTFIETDWGELRYTVHMPDKGVYQAAVGSLPDELMEWMADVAEEYGNDADLDDLIRQSEVEPPRIVFGEKVMDTFDRLLSECLEHDPQSGNPDHKLTQTPTNDIIRGMDPNQQTVPLGFQCIRLGSERSGIRGFRME